MSARHRDLTDQARDERRAAQDYERSRPVPTGVGTDRSRDDASRDDPAHGDRSHRTRERRVGPPTPMAPLASIIGKSRFIVIVAVVSVMLVAAALFIFGAGLAAQRIWHASVDIVNGNLTATSLTVELLEIVSVMLKAVVFYLIGVGFYSLFISPLNVTAALGIRSFNDLEIKIVSVVIVIMSVTFLEHFIVWDQAVETLLFGVSFGVVVAALVMFQMHSHRAAREDEHEDVRTRVGAQHEMFHEDHEHREIDPDEEIAESTENPLPGRSAGT